MSLPAVTVREHVARFFYAAALRLLTPAYLLRLWWRGRREPLYRTAVGERLGFYGDAPSAGWLWVHAVSLGETRAAAALVNALRELHPGLRLLLTHGTATGREAGRELLRPGDRQCWFPYDTPGATRRFLQHFKPSAGVLMETEIWPGLQAAALRAGVPMVLANARLSEKSLRMAQRVSALMQPATASLAVALAQTEADAARLRTAGAPATEVTGNLKFDMTPDAVLLARGQAWAQRVGRPIVLAASTREGEEALLLAAWARQPMPHPLLLVVPRHPQRFDEVAAQITAAGFQLARRSAWNGDAAQTSHGATTSMASADATSRATTAIPPDSALAADVWLGDSMREMPLYFSLAQVALLGGSFEKFGGQNLIEAAACGCPVVMGPHTYNFAEAAELSLAAGAAVRVAGFDEGVACACAMVAPQARSKHEWRQAQALAFAHRHRGAARRMALRVAAFQR